MTLININKMDFLITKEEIEAEIWRIERTFLNKLVVCREIINYCRKILESYRNEINSEGFQDITSEILFFKTQKQLPLSLLIYYSKLHFFYVQAPKGGKKFLTEFINTKLKKLNKFFLINSEFGEYIETNLSYLDTFYFTREFNNVVITEALLHFRDPDFNTSHDLLLGELKANKLFIKFLKQQLQSLDSDFSDTSEGKNELKWTGSKAGLTELIYALHEQKVFNNGNTDLKDIAAFFKEAFHFDTGDIYRTFSELKSRKKSRTPFLEELSINLLTKMRDSDY